MLKFLSILAAWFAAASAAASALSDYPFRVETSRYGVVEQVVARNDGPAPITIHVSLASENIGTTRDWPATAVVPAHGALPLGYIAPADPSLPYRYLFSYTYYVGRADAAMPANTLYRYPFPNGRAFAITQAHGGALTSHNNKQNFYAVDFDMPEGTPILAAREGVVVDVVLRYRRGGSDFRLMDSANMITIVHDDGTIAEYAHLAPGEALVKRGQHVKAGALLGYSGNTGFSTGPHLHFVVSRPEVENGKVIRLSLPVTFYADDSYAPVPPRAGTIAAADYGPASAPEPTADASLQAATPTTSHTAPLADQPLTARGSTDRR